MTFMHLLDHDEQHSLGQSAEMPLPAWDWYSASLVYETSANRVVEILRRELGGRLERMPGKNGYGWFDNLMHGEYRVAQVRHDGSQPYIGVVSSGSVTGAAVDVLRQYWPDHRVSRADSCFDFDAPDAWGILSQYGRDLAKQKRINTDVAGDWFGKVKGRTLNLGSRQSVTRLRIYEKGKQLPEAGRPDWVRCELEVKPQKAAKAALARLNPAEVWGCSAWSQEFADTAVGLDIGLVKMQEWRRPDAQRSRDALVRQYGGVLEDWAKEYGNDYATLGLVLGQLVSER